jgi:hypothetical protein
MGTAGRQGRRTRGKLNPFEWFTPTTGGSEQSQRGAWTGYLLDGDGEYAYINLQLPYNFAELEELALTILPYATLTPMYLRVLTDYCKNGEAYFEHNDQVRHKSINTVQYRMAEIDIKDAVDIRPVDAGDYIAVQVGRIAGQSPTHNTNALIIGVRTKILASQT